MIRTLIILILCLASAVLVSGQSTRQPNIIFILTDDYSASLVGFMPNLKAMQKEGVTFSNYFVSNSLCCPSRASIFTGMLPHNTGVQTNSKPDGGYEVYMEKGNAAESFCVSLQTAGYKTAMMGKFMNGYIPRQDSAPMGWSDWFVAGNGYDNFNYDINCNGKVLHFGKRAEDYLTDVLSARTDSLIKAWSNHPFFIEIATFTPHAPFTPAPRHENLFKHEQAPRTPVFNLRVDSAAPRWLKELDPLSEKQIDKLDHIFRKRLQCIMSIDEMLGHIRKVLNETGAAANTYIFFSSDNGYHLGDYGLFHGKQTPFDIDVRVPLIVVGPGVAQGYGQDEIVSNIDLAPTFAAMAGIPMNGDPDGHDIGHLLKDINTRKTEWRNFAIIEHKAPKFDRKDPDRQDTEDGRLPTYTALRFRDLLYVEYETGERSCYDLKTDPSEIKNIYPDLPVTMQKQLHDILLASRNCTGKNGCWDVQMMNVKAN